MKNKSITTVIVTDKHSHNETEIYDYVYECPNCKDITLFDWYNFCPNCACKLEWLVTD